MRTWNGAVPAAHAQFEAKRQALLREAASCFTRKGYHGTSLTEIAETLGVSKAALYTYVKSKDELLYFCHQAALDVAFDAITRAQSLQGSGLQKLCTGLENYLRAMLSDQTSYVLILEEHALLPEHARVIVERRDQFEAALRGLVVDGMADGSMVPCNPKLAIFATLGIVNWVMKWYTAGGPWTGDQIATEMVRYVERMLSGQPAPLLGILPMPGEPQPAVSA
ncbi:MAG TPA: TetR/AcrR family transcriptional regulator [Burkholderiaceae bacterium]